MYWCDWCKITVIGVKNNLEQSIARKRLGGSFRDREDSGMKGRVASQMQRKHVQDEVQDER